LKIELVPDLEHCIETVTRRKYAEFVQILLEKEDGDPETEEKLETLRLFLETADLRKLRAESEKYLAEGKSVRFMVYLEDGASRCEMHLTQASPQ